ncbi:MAG: CoA transferase [Deltaproteobacteria bacterium]|nr:CoA transferase [Deltaproteobacteria bacterium]
MTMPLEGIRVLDWTQWQQGPVSSVFLADLGADVIKVEHRVQGDPGRGMKFLLGIAVGQELTFNTYFESHNRNKRGITLDLSKEKGLEVFYRLVERSDVLVQNFRQHVPAKLKVDYETLSKINPRLIYAVGSSFGPEGPEAGDTAMDMIAQARSGIMSTIICAGEPPRLGQQGMADQVGATHLAMAILAALVAREKTGRGQKVEVSLLGSMCWFQQIPLTLVANVDMIPQLRPRSEQVNPIWNYYPCSDGNWVMLSMLQSDRYWADFCRVIGREDLVTDPRCENMFTRGEHCKAIIEELDRTFLTKSRDEWVKLIKEGGDFIVGPVNTIFEVIDDPQVLANKYVADFDLPSCGSVKIVNSPFHFSETPVEIRMPAPEFGQHTEEVLMELGGYTWEEIEKLRVEEII